MERILIGIKRFLVLIGKMLLFGFMWVLPIVLIIDKVNATFIRRDAGSLYESFAVIGYSIFIIVISTISAVSKRKYEREGSKSDYYFPYGKELEKYKAVGTLGAEYVKYSEWEKYIKDTYKSQLLCDDFYHYLNKKQRNSKVSCDVTIGAATPFAVLIITTEITSLIAQYQQTYAEMLDYIFYTNVFFITISIILIIKTVFDYKAQIYFIDDLFIIRDKIKNEHE